jgi:hypothetical protein
MRLVGSLFTLAKADHALFQTRSLESDMWLDIVLDFNSY